MMHRQPACIAIRRCWWLLLAITFAGCQNPPHRFDGAVGYTFGEQRGLPVVTYTAEATHDWGELESRALAACAHETGRPASKMQLTHLHRAEFARNVPVSVAYPAGVIIPQPSVGGGQIGSVREVPTTFTQTETVIRRLDFRRVTATCQAG